MNDLPILRMLGLAVLCVLLTATTGFVVGMQTNNFVAVLVAMLSAIAISGFFLLRWWLRAARSAGLPNAAKITRKQIIAIICYAIFVAGSATITYFTYKLTHDRMIEIGVALLLAIPGALIVRSADAAAPPPKAPEAAIFRLNVLLQTLMAIVFSLLIVQRMTVPRFEDLGLANDLILSGLLVTTPMIPVAAYFSWRRYLYARNLANDGLIGA